MTRKLKTKNNLEHEMFRVLNGLRHRYGFKLGYETEDINYTVPHKYIPDFVLSFKDGRVIYVEAKGYLRPEDRTKILSVKAQNPDKDIRIVFQTDNKLNKSTRTRYSDWAKKHGIPFAIGEVPLEWFI
jgi:hypothetical protein